MTTAKKADEAPAGGGFDYLRAPGAIYAASFAAIDALCDFSHLPEDARPVAARMVHACGVPEIAGAVVASKGAAAAGRNALASGAPLLVDAEMVANGIIRARLPRNNDIVCALNDEGVRQEAAARGETRSAVAMERMGGRFGGAVVAIGNAPTALYRLLELLAAGAARPALVIGVPVGFIGAAEAKDALVAHNMGVPFITLKGRMGGSAIAAAAVNALAGNGDGR